MRCDYCGRKIQLGKEGEHEVSIFIDGGRKSIASSGIARREYHCCSYECRVNMFDILVKRMSKEEVEKEQLKEENDVTEMMQKKKPSKITVPNVALIISILALVFQIFCHIILPIVI
jgi:hypothetical protein